MYHPNAAADNIDNMTSTDYIVILLFLLIDPTELMQRLLQEDGNNLPVHEINVRCTVIKSPFIFWLSVVSCLASMK
jgi:hypothetical protein